MENQLKATELRLNNLIEYDGKLFTVKTIGNKIISADRGKGLVEFDVIDLKPIQLTEDILVKLGFEPATNHDFVKANLFLIDFGGKYYRAFLGGSQRITKELTSVHQLQNLYFSLTGEELTFKN